MMTCRFFKSFIHGLGFGSGMIIAFNMYDIICNSEYEELDELEEVHEKLEESKELEEKYKESKETQTHENVQFSWQNLFGRLSHYYSCRI